MVKRINLALQGGGAHGAYTWGVLDRLLTCEDIQIAAMSGTSAGALNGAAVKAGLAAGGREAARANLDWVWTQVAGIGDLRIVSWMVDLFPPTAWMTRALERADPYSVGDAVSRATSPYSLGPFYRNPLERIVRDLKFDQVCAADGPELHICATNVRSGKIRVFTGAEIGPEAIMASACLPTLFQAIEIDGEAYWDGGYTGNPALFPLYKPELPDDIVIVNINPLERRELPIRAQNILNRINEISFNSSLFRELRAIDFVRRLIADGRMPQGAMKDVLVHMISDDRLMNDLGVTTKLVPSPILMQRLKRAGQVAADTFLSAHLNDLGERATVDLAEMFG